MAKFLHAVQLQDSLVAADGIESVDLGVNPLSVILICLRPLNDTGTLAAFETYLGIAGAMNRVTLLHNGAQVISMTGRDAAAMAYFRHGCVPSQATHVNTNNDRRIVVIPLFLGKNAYDTMSAFPQTRRGELVLEVDFDIAAAGYDGMRWSIETIELLGASPKEYERQTQLGVTFGATGINDVELPIGNLVRGLLCFGTTGFAGATPAPTLGRMSTLVNNQAIGYSSVDFEVAAMLNTLWGRQPPSMDAHLHGTTVDGNAGTSVTTLGSPREVGSDGYENYCFLDMDPSRDDTFAVDTSGASRFHLEVNAEASNAVRVVTVERIKV